MCAQVPELLKPDVGDIDNVVGLCDWRSWKVAVGEDGGEGHDEAGKVFVEGEKAEKFGCGLAVALSIGFGGLRIFLICRHGLGVQVGDFENVDWDAATVATTGPLWVLLSKYVRICSSHICMTPRLSADSAGKVGKQLTRRRVSSYCCKSIVLYKVSM